MKKENKVIMVKKYTIIDELFEDGTHQMARTNDGFTALELIGLADLISWDIREQIMGRIYPDKIKRQVIEE